MYKLIRNIGFAVVSLGLGMASCDEDYPKSHIEPYDTELLSIKILNAGANGDKVVEGTIDEAKKTINFPRLDVETDFSALSIEAELSEGAALQSEVMDYSMDAETNEKTQVLRIINHNRYKDYLMKVRKRVPVFGADFEKPMVYNFSGDNIYSDFADAGSTRCASFDGEHVLIVSRRSNVPFPHLLKVSDLKKGEINPIYLNVTDVTGGTFPCNMGALINGHVYLSSLSGGKVSPFKIYYWETPTSNPEIIANINVENIPGAGLRHGDNASYNLDENGNGFMFFGDNKATEFLKVPINGHKTVDIGNIKVLPSKSDATMVTNVYRIGDTDQYLWSGIRVPVTLVDESLGEKYKSKIAGEAVAPRIISFNKERYLLVCTAGYGGKSGASIALEMYDLTKGETIEEALKKFDEGENHNPIYQFKLGGSGHGNALAQTDYYIEKDENGKDAKLCVFASRTGSGFVICEFPIKQEEMD